MQETQTAQLVSAIRANTKAVEELVDIQRSHSGLFLGTVVVEKAGEAIRGTNRPLPNGVVLSIRLRPVAGSSVTGYVITSERDARRSRDRKEMEEGETLELKIANPYTLFFDATRDGTVFELMAEVD